MKWEERLLPDYARSCISLAWNDLHFILQMMRKHCMILPLVFVEEFVYQNVQLVLKERWIQKVKMEAKYRRELW